jgi:hypothetical protein
VSLCCLSAVSLLSLCCLSAVSALTLLSPDEKYVPKSRRFTEIYPRWHLSEDLWSEVEREADAVDDMKNGFEFEG